MKKKKILSYYEQLNTVDEEEDIYEADGLEELEESDEIDSAEAGFMRGYIGEEEEWILLNACVFYRGFYSLVVLEIKISLIYLKCFKTILFV